MSAERVQNSEQPPKSDFGDDSWYEKFVSIIFGVFIAVWIVPFAAPVLTKENGESFVITHALDFSLRGLLMFLVLICLWWWYARFIGIISPARGFSLFTLDFITLASFALSFRFWSDDFAYPVTIIVGSILMFSRLSLLLLVIWKIKRIRWIVVAALVASGAIFAGCTIFVVAIMYRGSSESQEQIWNDLGIIVTSLLFFGILVTLVAVYCTETLSVLSPKLNWYTNEKQRGSRV